MRALKRATSGITLAMDFNDIVAALGAQFGLPGLDANSDGPCALVINGIDVTLTPHGDNEN